MSVIDPLLAHIRIVENHGVHWYCTLWPAEFVEGDWYFCAYRNDHGAFGPGSFEDSWHGPYGSKDAAEDAAHAFLDCKERRQPNGIMPGRLQDSVVVGPRP